MPGMTYFTHDELTAVLDAMVGVMASRNRALLMLAVETGFRSREIRSLNRGDLLTADGMMVREVQVKARYMKGGHAARTVPLVGISKTMLENWLIDQAETWGIVHRDAPAFSTSSGRRLSYPQHNAIINSAVDLAGIRQGRRFGTHSTRKTFAKENLDALVGAVMDGTVRTDPIVELCLMMGHADPRATMHYVPRTNAADLARERRRQQYEDAAK